MSENNETIIGKKVKIFSSKGFKYEGTITEETDLFYTIKENNNIESMLNKNQIDRIILIKSEGESENGKRNNN